jgi:hypothetical protein
MGGTSGSSGASGSSGTSGGSGATCADLKACCARVKDPSQHTGCKVALDTAEGDEAKCGADYDLMKSLCP